MGIVHIKVCRRWRYLGESSSLWGKATIILRPDDNITEVVVIKVMKENVTMMFQYKFMSQVLGSQRLQKATKLRMTMKTKLKKLGSSEPRLDISLRTVDTSFQIMEADLPKVGTHPALEASFWNPAQKNWLASNQNGILPVFHDFPQNRPPSPLEKEQGSHLGRQRSTQTTQDLAQV